MRKPLFHTKKIGALSGIAVKQLIDAFAGGKYLRISLVGFIFLLLQQTSVNAQLGVYDFTGAGVCPNQNPAVIAQPTNAAFSTFANAGTICVATANGFVTRAVNTNPSIDLTRYNQFTITPNSGYDLTLTNLAYNFSLSSITGTSGWILRSSLDNYVANIAGGQITSTAVQPSNIVLPASFANIPGVTFRFYIIDANGNNAQFLMDDVTLTGVANLLPATPLTPTSNSPQCGNVGVTMNAAAPPINETWYWQTTALGTSTTNATSSWTVYSSGTYYLRARNNITNSWSATSAAITITITPDVATPVFALGAISNNCQAANSVTYTATAANASGIVYSLDATSIAGGNGIDVLTGIVTYVATWTGTSVVTATANGCNGPTTASHTIYTNPAVGMPSFTVGSTSNRCQGANAITYTATASNSTGISYTIDAASIAGGNSINPATGVLTYSAGWFGSTTITASAAGCYGPKTATHVVTTTATVGTPIFALGSSSARCQSAGVVTYNATATTNTGITYSLDATSITGGNTINATTGEVTFQASWIGTSVITASATGCSGPATATHTVVTSGPVGIPVFALGNISTICQGTGTVTYTATVAYASSINYSLDAASITGGNSINSSTGAVTYVAGWSGTSIITVSAAGCYGPQTATHTVTITPTVGTPVFALGATTTRCQGAGVVSYAATATTTTGITYSLNAPSIAAGNTINSTTGDVTFVAGYSGTTIITASAAGCNGPRTSTHTITITPTVGTPVFGLGATSTRCQAASTVPYTATATTNTGIAYSLDAASIAAGNAINSATGAVTYVNTWSGTSVITATATGCNGPSIANHTVTITPLVATPVFTLGATSVRCQGAGSVTYTATATNSTGITYSLDAASITGGNTINATTGVVNYAAAWTGTSIITASAAGCSGPQIATHTVTITPTVGTPVFALGATSSRCQAAGTVTYSATATTTTGITYTLDAASITGGNTINATTGDVTYAAGWTGTTIITASAAGCNGPRTATHTVTINAPVATPVFTLGATTTRCQGAGTVTYTATAAATSGITYILDGSSIAVGNTINAATGAVTYVAGWSGTTTITASAAGCYGPQIAQHVVTVTPTVGTPVFTLGATSIRCQGAGTLSYDASSTNTTGITYSLNGAAITGGNSINASTGVVTYAAGWTGATVITASAAGCNGPRTSTHTVTITPTVGTPVFGLGATSTRCQAAGPVTYTASATNNTGITYSLDASSIAAGNSINSSTGIVTYDVNWNGTSVITATATGCNGPSTSSHTVTINGLVSAPVFTLGATSVRCQGAGSATYTATSNNTTGITYSLNAASVTGGNSINATTGVVTWATGWSGSTIITASAAGCSGPQTATHTVTITPTLGVPVFALGATSTRCQTAETISYSATATTNTGITYSLDAASLSAGNSIDVNTGSVTWANTWNGTSTITTSATGCNGPRTATHTVTTTGLVSIPVFTLGDNSARCQAGANIFYTATANNTTGITYSLDAASIAAGVTINTANGRVSYLAGYVGTAFITATATGCDGPQTATHTAVTSGPVAIPVFTIGATSTRCQGAGVVNYAATALYTTGITYTLDLTSRNAGNTINATTSDVTYVAGWSGTSTITASAAGCSGPRTSTHTVTITPTVGVPVFSLGATSTRCQAAGLVTYTATATNNTGITYSLDAPSIAAGNSINTATGAVSYVAGWSGTSIVTAIAAGCNGPSAAVNHTITITPVVGTPVFAAGTTSTRCQGAGSTTYTATAISTSGITYSLDAPSIAGGNTIVAATGAVTFAAAWSGTTIITSSAAGCSGPQTATHTITITPTVGTPVFALGASSSRCQAAGTVSYSATVTNSTGINFSLDAASIAGGNTINPATGDVTYQAGWSGTTVITATATGCNGPRSATHTITVNAPVVSPVFTLGTTSSRCQGAGTIGYSATAANSTAINYTIDATSAAAGNTIVSTTGAVTYVAGWSGTTTVTASAAGCYGPVTTIHTITTTATVGTPVFTLGSTTTRCQGSGTVTYTATASFNSGITYSLDGASVTGGNTINSSTGMVTYVNTWSGTSTITASAAGCNGPRTATHTVTITPTVGLPVFALGASSTRCQGINSVTYTATSTNNTGITYSLDAASIAAGNSINTSTGAVTFVGSWSGTSTVTADATGCNGPRTSTHTITTTATVATPIFASGATSVRCQGAGSINYNASASFSTGISYTLDAASVIAGNTINSSSGVVTWVTTWSGSSVVTANATGCNGPSTATHTISTTPTVSTPVFMFGATSSRCQAAGTISYTATATNATGITYSLDAASITGGNSINAATGAVSFVSSWSGTTTITASAAGCNGPRTTTHVVTISAPVTTPVFSSGATSTRCQGAGTITYTATASNTTGITYTLDFGSTTAGNSINSTTGAVSYVATWSGISIITASAAGCYGPIIATHTVTTSATVGTPVFGLGAGSTRCQGAGTVAYTATAASSTGITYSLDAASITAGNSINSGSGTVTYTAAWSGTSIITASASGCNGPRTATHTVTINITVITPVFTLGANSSRCRGAGVVNYTANSANASGITYSLDGASIAAGNTINPTTGDVTYVGSWSGTTTVTASAAGCNGPRTATHVVSVNNSVGVPSFALGASSTRCQGGTTVSYTATAAFSTSIVYSIDSISIIAGNTIDSVTGVVTFIPQWSGASTVTATANGCNGPAISTHVINTTASVGLVTFSFGPTSSRCQSAGPVSYAATASSATGFTYSLDGFSIMAGNTINSITGVVTYTSTWIGTSIITATASGCNGPSVGTHSAVTNGVMGSLSFALGSASTRCRGAGIVTYVASAPNATGITFTLDNASLAAGNVINPSTGGVNFVSTWSGTSTITATAEGCTGPRVAVHTITTTPNTCAFTMFDKATIERIPTGSKIINMGIVPQTIGNALKPYGLVYQLLANQIPVRWVFNQSKLKDGVDLVHNGITYRGSAFIITAPFLTPAINSLISTWEAKGVVVNTTLFAFDVEVANTLRSKPFWVMDDQNGNIAVGFLQNAEIPSTAYIFKSPAQLNNCDDIYVMPHADPTWETHKNLYYWNLSNKGGIWAGCHAVSVLENVYGPDTANAAVTRRMNFLMNDGPGIGNSAVLFNDHANASPPNNQQYPGTPVMQFMGKTDLAHTGGSEQVFMPNKAGSWRSSTMIGVFDPSQADVPALSNGPAAQIAFGRAFGDDQRGWVLYEGGHNINVSNPDGIAAMRTFLNFGFFSIRDKQPSVVVSGAPKIAYSGQSYALNAVASSQISTYVTFSYEWTSNCGGVFSNPYGASTTFIAPTVASATPCAITCKVTDNCGRLVFETKPLTVTPGPKAPLCASETVIYNPCDGNYMTVDVLANDSDPDGGALSVTLLTSGTNGTFTNNGNGTITYTPGYAFSGSDKVDYSVCNPNGMCCTATLTVNVALMDANGCSPDEYYTIVGNITALRGTSVGGTAITTIGASTSDPDGIVGNAATYALFSNKNHIVNYALSAPIPKADTLYFYVDGSANAAYTVSQSSDSLSWTNPIQFTLTGTENFLASRANAYPVSAGIRFIKVTIQTTSVQIDAMQYFVRSCVSAAPVSTNDDVQTLEDMPVIIEVDANDIDPRGLPLRIAQIVVKPKYGALSINLNNTITYLNYKDQVGNGRDTFVYRTCNTAELCSLDTVYITIIKDNCAPGKYRPGTYSVYSSTINPTADNYLRLNNNGTNYGNNNSIVIKGKSNDFKRGILQFNTSLIPSNAIIDVATLRLYQTSGPTDEALKIHRVTTPWAEMTSTWGRNNATTFWTNPGGDFSNVIVAAGFLTGPTNSYKSFNIRSVVQDWVSQTYPNYGVVATRYPENAGTSDITFNSVQNGSNRPLLYISYRVPLACTDIPAYAPLAMPDTATTNSVQPVTLTVMSNDFDYNNTGCSIALLGTTTAKGGTVSLTAGNKILYTPPATLPSFNGVDTFSYRMINGTFSDTANCFVLVTNAPPKANPDSYILQSNTATTPTSLSNANIRVNDSDPEGAALSLPVVIKDPRNGIATINGSGLLSYVPNLNFLGNDTLAYEITEMAGNGCVRFRDTSTIVITITNRPPISVNDNFTSNACEAVRISVLNNDMDPEAGNMTVQIVTQPSIGSVAVINNNSEILFTPPSGISNITTSFTYRACDNATPSLCGNTVTVNVTIRPLPAINTSPVAVRDTFRVPLNSVLYADVLTNDYDPDKNDFRLPLTIETNPKNGSVLPLQNGLIQYIPNASYFGRDSFQYRVYDTIMSIGGCPAAPALSSITWVYILVQDKPIANWDLAVTSKNIPVTINVLNNDLFGAWGPANGTISIVTAPTRGAVSVLSNGSTVQANNTLSYTPNTNYFGRDSLVYRICDAFGNCDTAIVYIRIGNDSDGDGVADEIDIDDDNDGITDYIEACGAGATSFSCTPAGSDPSGDEDNDGILNFRDSKWAPLNSNGCSIFLDTDGDGVPDYLDLDSDNDGIADVVEALGVDANGDGIIDNYCDTDADGLSQNVDANNTGAMGSGFGLGAPDFDNDGLPNADDVDSDNDGIPDIVESYGQDLNNDGRIEVFTDTDNDGWANQFDGDADGNGIVENVANVLIVTGNDPAYINCASPGTGRPGCYPLNGNADNVGFPNFIDLDSDGDGVTDATESGLAISYSRGMVSGCSLVNGWCSTIRSLPALNLRNTDGHGRPDVYDIDSDNDGITDNIEAQPTHSYIIPIDLDGDGDGLINVYDFFGGVGGNGLTPYDHDADGVPDYRDTDTDNDGAPDRNEGDYRNKTMTQALINGDLDSDGDGLMDCFDINDIRSELCGVGFTNVSMSNMGTNGNFNGPAPGGSSVQLVRSSPTAPDRDWRNTTTLPINIISFTGSLNNSIATLVWKVENEQVVDKYVVERSMDGVNFSAEAIRLSNNLPATSYSVADDLTNYIHPIVYYRVLQVNKDGQRYYTKTLLFNLGKTMVLTPSAYPNPVIDVLTVAVPSLTRQQVTITLSDASGKTVLVKKVYLEKGDNKFLVEGVERLSKGLYMVQIKTTDVTTNIKVVKQ